jgi:predicted dehydrogenase
VPAWAADVAEEAELLPVPQPVRWGVMASSAQVAQLAVLPAIVASPKADLVATASLSGAGDGFGAARAYDSYDALLGDGEVDAVYIALPNSLHREWTERAAEAGKHVLCEKPLACDAAEAQAMADACDRAGVLLLEAYMTPFHPRSTVLEDVLRSERLGRLLFARTSFTGTLQRPDDHRWRPEMGGGALLDVGIYCLAPLLLAAGRLPEAVAASARMTDGGVDASFSGWLDFGDGFSASFDCSFEAPERQRIDVIGTEAVITVERTFTPGPDDTRIQLLHRDGTVEDLVTGGGDPYRGMIDHVAAVLSGSATPRRTPAQSVELLGLIDRLRAAAAGA